MILSMEVKKDTTVGNLLSIAAMFTSTSAAQAYYNANVIFLLRSPEYFAIENASEVGRVNSNIVFYSLIVSMSSSFFMG